MNFLVVSAASLAVLVVVYGITFLVGRRIGRYNVVDVDVGLWASSRWRRSRRRSGTGDLFRRLLLLVLVAVWGLRLAWHMDGKSAGKGEDPRYDDLLRGDFSAGNVLRKIFVMQAAAAWFISLPLQLSAVLGPTPPVLRPVLIAGVVVCGSSAWFSRPSATTSCACSRPTRPTRASSWTAGCGRGRGIPTTSATPCVWWGLWLVTINGWLSLVTVLSPVLMTYFLVYATGARLTEKYMADRPGFDEYCSRTSFFVPRPPRCEYHDYLTRRLGYRS